MTTQTDDFWDYERQVDLEGFSSKRVYQELADQSHRLTASLGNQKEQVC